MIKNSINNQGIKTLSKSIRIGLSSIISSIFQPVGYNPPGVENCMLVPTAVQSSSYYVSQTNKFHP